MYMYMYVCIYIYIYTYILEKVVSVWIFGDKSFFGNFLFSFVGENPLTIYTYIHTYVYIHIYIFIERERDTHI